MKIRKLFFLLLPVLFTEACVSQKFSDPENSNKTDPGFAQYKTISELQRSMGTAGTKEIKENIVISGIVIAEDRSGNFYKQIIIDDGTAAMPVLLDAYNLYGDFPVGRRIYVKCKGLYTNFYYKLPQLGFSPNGYGGVQPIPFLLWDQFIIKSAIGNEVKPIEVSIADAKKAKPELYNRLITIREVQLLDTAAATQYALPATLATATSIKIMDCDSNQIILRTSGYSNFQGARPPCGQGSMTVIYTVYNNTPQLILRDTADVQMRSLRCP